VRALLTLFALLLLGATGPVRQPSFSCQGALTPTEQAICADPELAAWDRAIDVLYPRQLKERGITRVQQKEWLDRRNTCAADPTCIRRSYGAWPGYPGDPGWPSFSRRARYDTGTLSIAPLGGGWYGFSIQAIHIVFDRRGKMLTANEGNFDGVVLVRNGRGHFSSEPGSEFSCEIDFALRADGWRIADNGQCGGLNVILDGDYLPDRKSTRK
jgi:hypothetical protein